MTDSTRPEHHSPALSFSATGKHQRTVILVCGMHRSGTSALSAACHFYGADLGRNLAGPAADNPKGFWEDRAVVKLNDEILSELGLAWHSIASPAPDWWRANNMQQFRERAVNLIERTFSKETLIAIKDPRISRLLPFWMEVLAAGDFTACELIAIRHPSEVADSLRVRNGIGREHAYLLWLLHSAEAFKSRPARYCMVRYDALLNTPSETMREVGKRISVEWPVEADQAARLTTAFLEPMLRHHVVESEFLPSLSPRLDEAVWKFYEALTSGTTQQQSLALPSSDIISRERLVVAGSTNLTSVESGQASADIAAADPKVPVKRRSSEPSVGRDVGIGRVDILNANEIVGWTWDPKRPDEPIAVEILDGDQVVLTVMADAQRPDLAKRGLGDGRHAFQVRPITSFFPHARHLVRVRRQFDGIDLPGSSRWITNDKTPFDETANRFLEQTVASTLATAKRPEDLEYCLSVLLNLLNQTINASNALATTREAQAKSLSALAAQAHISDFMAALVGKLQREYPPLHFEPAEQPLVSVVIPAFNNFAHTYKCLQSIHHNLPERSFEIVLVDDCSTDETMLCSLVISGIRVHRNKTNLNFVHACNAGAEQARGKYLYFLNNDTTVMKGWLDELVATFENTANVGIAGSRLRSEDGNIQDAGGIVWRMGDAWNWGRGRDPSEPQFSFLRDADWVSGAALMIPRDLFGELNGFNSLFAPAYYEDTDLAFRVRAAGKRTIVQPASEVVHVEGASNGTDTTGTGSKRYQLINQRKFYERWKDTLASHRFNGHEPDLEAERNVTKRALFVDDTVPTPDRDTGSNAALQHMLVLMDLGYKVVFLPADNMSRIDPYTRDLQKLGIECLYAPYFWSVDEVFRKLRHKPDLVYLHRYSNASRYGAMMRRYFPGCRVLYNVADDVHFLRLERQAKIEGNSTLEIKAAEMRKTELACMRQVDAVLVHSSYEAAYLANIEPTIQIAVVPWTVRLNPSTLPFAERSGFAFIGGFAHHPNVDAVACLTRDIMPLLRKKRLGAPAYIAGSNTPTEVTAMQANDVNVIGHMPILSDLLHRMRATVVPLRYGAGIKGKVLDSFAHGIPCVMSEIAAEGLDLPRGLAWLIAHSPQEFADKLARLLTDVDLNQDISARGLKYIAANYSKEMVTAALERVLNPIQTE